MYDIRVLCLLLSFLKILQAGPLMNSIYSQMDTCTYCQTRPSSASRFKNRLKTEVEMKRWRKRRKMRRTKKRER